MLEARKKRTRREKSNSISSRLNYTIIPHFIDVVDTPFVLDRLYAMR